MYAESLTQKINLEISHACRAFKWKANWKYVDRKQNVWTANPDKE